MGRDPPCCLAVRSIPLLSADRPGPAVPSRRADRRHPAGQSRPGGLRSREDPGHRMAQRCPGDRRTRSYLVIHRTSPHPRSRRCRSLLRRSRCSNCRSFRCCRWSCFPPRCHCRSFRCCRWSCSRHCFHRRSCRRSHRHCRYRTPHSIRYQRRSLHRCYSRRNRHQSCRHRCSSYRPRSSSRRRSLRFHSRLPPRPAGLRPPAPRAATVASRPSGTPLEHAVRPRGATAWICRAEFVEPDHADSDLCAGAWLIFY